MIRECIICKENFDTKTRKITCSEKCNKIRIKNWHKKENEKINKDRKLNAKDEHRAFVAKQNGYNIKFLWEFDYLKDKEKAIQNCIEFLQE